MCIPPSKLPVMFFSLSALMEGQKVHSVTLFPRSLLFSCMCGVYFFSCSIPCKSVSLSEATTTRSSINWNRKRIFSSSEGILFSVVSAQMAIKATIMNIEVTTCDSQGDWCVHEHFKWGNWAWKSQKRQELTKKEDRFTSKVEMWGERLLC